MAHGSVEWFNEQKGYGYIRPDDDSPYVFVHLSAVQQTGLRRLAKGQKITYDLQTRAEGKTAAINLRIG